MSMTDLERARVERLERALEAVLFAWSYEAKQGPNIREKDVKTYEYILEQNAKVYEEAIAALCEGKS